MAERLPSKCKALSSNSSTAKKQKSMNALRVRKDLNQLDPLAWNTDRRVEARQGGF
jgi:hypothetical protein